MLIAVFLMVNVSLLPVDETTTYEDTKVEKTQSFFFADNENDTISFDLLSPIKPQLSENIENITISNVTDNTATISWSYNTFSMSTTFDVYMYDNVFDCWHKIKSVSNENEISIKNLGPNHKYRIGIKVDSDNYISKEIEFETKLTKPTISITKFDENEVELSFDTNDNYEIYRKSDENFEMIGITDQNYFIDKEITKGISYEYKVKRVFGNKSSDFSNTVSADIPDTTHLGLPDIKCYCKTWAHYTAVTATGSPQYKLLHSDACYTDPETGIRMVDGCYCIALGSYYGSTIGTKYHITLSSGNEFDAILCDQKADAHTNSTHQYAVNNQDMIEFYIEAAYKPACVGGDYSALPQFEGYITSIELINS